MQLQELHLHKGISVALFHHCLYKKRRRMLLCCLLSLTIHAQRLRIHSANEASLVYA